MIRPSISRGSTIKPLALRAVWQVAKLKAIPIIGVGGIATIDDVMEYYLAGATAVQIGTANFYDPTAAERIVNQLPEALTTLSATTIGEIVGSAHTAG